MAAVRDPQQRSTPGPSQTQTETTNTQSRVGTQTILRLRGAHAPSRTSVRWAEDVVDNEGLGRKSSKVCCIYHRPKGVDESSDESSSDSSSDSDSDSDGGGRRRVPSADHKGKGKGKGKGKSKKDHDCDDPDHEGHRHGRKGDRDGKQDRRPSPNAYERVPKPPKPKDEAGEGSKQPRAKA